ncbi:MAG: sugar ABC transporter substrate-binding protein [Firmicutes bacterium]|nr:sugar ABC transporter substrate-binding protein [Bacillota bacterium]
MKRHVTVVFSLALIVATTLFVSLTVTAKPKTTIEFMETLTSPARTVFVKELITEFEKENPDIHVELLSVPWEQAHDKILTLMAAGNLPDVLEMAANWVAEMSATGKVEDLGPYLEKWEYKDTLSESGLALGRTYKNTQYVIPQSLYFQCMYYRPDWLKEKDLPVPTTIDEFYNAVNKVTNPSKNRYGYAFRGGMGTWTHVLNFIMAAGGWTNYFDDQGRAVFRDPKAVAAFKRFMDMYFNNAPADALNWGYAETVNAFTTGTAGFIIQDSEVIGTCEEAMSPGTFAVAPHPVAADGKRYLVSGYIGLSMMSDSKNKDAAWKFISFLLRPDINTRWGKATTTIPITKAAWQDPFFSQGHIAAYTQTLQDPRTVFFMHPDYLPEWGEFFSRITVKEIQSYLLGRQDAKATMDAISDYLESALAKYKSKK